MNASPLQQLAAFQHADGFFPSGAFAFSQGLEASAALLGEGFDLNGFVLTQLHHRWAPADRVALIRAHRCQGDLAVLADFDQEIEASSLCEALRDGSKRNGAGLLTAHERLGTPGAAAYRGAMREGHALGHLSVVQGLVWQALMIDEATAVMMSGYGAVNAYISAAIRLGLIGALEAQILIQNMLPEIASAACSPVADDQPLASFSPLVEIAVSRRVDGDLRLFSN